LTTSPDTYTVIFAADGRADVSPVFDTTVFDTTEVVANGILASGGGGGTRTTHHTPTTMTATPNAEAKIRLNPIQ
jgi:hypothetical protein